MWHSAAAGRRIRGAELKSRVESALRDAAIWDEVKDKLPRDGRSLTGGQQQRLCIARAIAVKPEFCCSTSRPASLDPISTLRVEEPAGAARETLHRGGHAQFAAAARVSNRSPDSCSWANS